MHKKLSPSPPSILQRNQLLSSSPQYPLSPFLIFIKKENKTKGGGGGFFKNLMIYMSLEKCNLQIYIYIYM